MAFKSASDLGHGMPHMRESLRPHTLARRQPAYPALSRQMPEQTTILKESQSAYPLLNRKPTHGNLAAAVLEAALSEGHTRRSGSVPPPLSRAGIAVGSILPGSISQTLSNGYTFPTSISQKIPRGPMRPLCAVPTQGYTATAITPLINRCDPESDDDMLDLPSVPGLHRPETPSSVMSSSESYMPGRVETPALSADSHGTTTFDRSFSPDLMSSESGFPATPEASDQGHGSNGMVSVQIHGDEPTLEQLISQSQMLSGLPGGSLVPVRLDDAGEAYVVDLSKAARKQAKKQEKALKEEAKKEAKAVRRATKRETRDIGPVRATSPETMKQDENALRRAAEVEAELQAFEAENRREEKARLRREKQQEEEGQKQAQAEADRLAEEEESARLDREAEERARQVAMEVEKKRLAKQEAKRLAREEARKEAKDLAKRIALEEAQQQTEIEARKQAKEAAKRLAFDEAQKQTKMEEERRRLKAEEDARQVAAKVEEAEREAALAEIKRLAEREEARQQAAWAVEEVERAHLMERDLSESTENQGLIQPKSTKKLRIKTREMPIEDDPVPQLTESPISMSPKTAAQLEKEAYQTSRVHANLSQMANDLATARRVRRDSKILDYGYPSAEYDPPHRTEGVGLKLVTRSSGRPRAKSKSKVVAMMSAVVPGVGGEDKFKKGFRSISYAELQAAEQVRRVDQQVMGTHAELALRTLHEEQTRTADFKDWTRRRKSEEVTEDLQSRLPSASYRSSPVADSHLQQSSAHSPQTPGNRRSSTQIWRSPQSHVDSSRASPSPRQSSHTMPANRRTSGNRRISYNKSTEGDEWEDMSQSSSESVSLSEQEVNFETFIPSLGQDSLPRPRALPQRPNMPVRRSTVKLIRLEGKGTPNTSTVQDIEDGMGDLTFPKSIEPQRNPSENAPWFWA